MRLIQRRVAAEYGAHDIDCCEMDDSGWKHELELVDSENGSARTARLKKTFANTDLSDSPWTVREESGGKS